MEEKKNLVSSLQKFITTFEVLDADRGLVYINTGEAEGITVQVVRRGKPQPITHYLSQCTESWVTHDLLRTAFDEEEIWNAILLGYLKLMKSVGCYSIETDKLPK